MNYFLCFKPNLEYLYQILSCKKYKTIFVTISTPPIVAPIFQEPVITQESKKVSNVPITLQEIVFAKCLLYDTTFFSIFVTWV